MGRYKARHLYCSEMSSNKLWDHSLTLTDHLVIWRGHRAGSRNSGSEGARCPGQAGAPPARAWVPPLCAGLTLSFGPEDKEPVSTSC